MKRLRPAEWAVLVGASGLLVTLFLDWYDLVAQGTGVGFVDRSIERTLDQISTSGWSSLGWFTLLVLTICIVAGLILCVLTVAGVADGYVLPPAVVLAVLGKPALLVLLVVVVVQPGLGVGAPNDAVELTAAGWLGIACAVLLVGGGLLSIRDERTTGSDRVYSPPAPRPVPPA